MMCKCGRYLCLHGTDLCWPCLKVNKERPVDDSEGEE
jgi:hypothetical protein